MMVRTVILVSGSRDWTDEETIYQQLRKHPPGSILVHGAQRGADLISDRCARRLRFLSHGTPYFRDEGKRGGSLRNSCMLGDVINKIRFGFDPYFYAFPLPESIGTWDMVRKVKRHNADIRALKQIPIWIYPVAA